MMEDRRSEENKIIKDIRYLFIPEKKLNNTAIKDIRNVLD